MEVFARLIVMFAANLTAVLVASYYVADFRVTANVQGLLPTVLGLTIINLFLRPLLKIIFSPLIFVTFGLFTIIINAGLLLIIDFYSISLTISGLRSLLYATSIISLTNLIINYAALFLYRRPELT